MPILLSFKTKICFILFRMIDDLITWYKISWYTDIHNIVLLSLCVLACNNKLFHFRKWARRSVSTLHSVLISVKDAKQSFFFRLGYPGRLGVQFCSPSSIYIYIYIPEDSFISWTTHYFKITIVFGKYSFYIAVSN